MKLWQGEGPASAWFKVGAPKDEKKWTRGRATVRLYWFMLGEAEAGTGGMVATLALLAWLVIQQTGAVFLASSLAK